MTTQTINLNNLKKGDTCVVRNGWRQVWDGLKRSDGYGGVWYLGPLEFRKDGDCPGFSDFDIIEIIPAPEPIVGYVNVYPDKRTFGSPWSKLEDAKEQGDVLNAAALLKITYNPDTREASAEVIEADNKAGGV